MIGIDTNVLVRYIVADHPAQYEKARHLLQDACSAESPGLINAIVLCELVWVLSRAYRYPRERIAAALSMLLAAKKSSLRTRRKRRRHSLSIVRRTLTSPMRSSGCEIAISVARQQ